MGASCSGSYYRAYNISSDNFFRTGSSSGSESIHNTYVSGTTTFIINPLTTSDLSNNPDWLNSTTVYTKNMTSVCNLGNACNFHTSTAYKINNYNSFCYNTLRQQDVNNSLIYNNLQFYYYGTPYKINTIPTSLYMNSFICYNNTVYYTTSGNMYEIPLKVYELNITAHNQNNCRINAYIFYKGNFYNQSLLRITTTILPIKFKVLPYNSYNPKVVNFSISLSDFTNCYDNLTVYYGLFPTADRYNSLSILSYINPISEIMLFFGVSGVVVFEIKHNRRGKR